MFCFQLVTSLGVLLFVVAMYETFEYIFCYNDEKKEQSKELKMLKRVYRRTGNHVYGEVPQTDSLERDNLLNAETGELGSLHDNNTGCGNSLHEPTDILLETFHTVAGVDEKGEGQEGCDLDHQGLLSAVTEEEDSAEVETSFLEPLLESR